MTLEPQDLLAMGILVLNACTLLYNVLTFWSITKAKAEIRADRDQARAALKITRQARDTTLLALVKVQAIADRNEPPF